ncbi:hypothetical protein FACS1894163_00560 [Spirochaetia bacterium]|nr:hypothetical protein FACS1894163_00560 [Spirochaetia bacterium]
MKGKTMRRSRALLLLLCVILFSSCMGVRADITVKADGSGRISLEYRVSRQMEALGQLDGNLNQPTIPVGRQDFERSLARLPGLTLRSFSSKQDEKNIINQAEIDFAGLEALIPFLDAAGEGASLSRTGGQTSLRLTLSRGAADIDEDLLSLAELVSAGYEAAISLAGPRETSLALFDHSHQPIQTPKGAEWVKSGKKASIAIPIPQLLSLREGLELEFTW